MKKPNDFVILVEGQPTLRANRFHGPISCAEIAEMYRAGYSARYIGEEYKITPSECKFALMTGIRYLNTKKDKK